jgi:8-oxo-dGTP diphosphatase
VAVACFVFTTINDRFYVLANQRGEGSADFHGYWNAPCGYLDFGETTAEAAIRETYEETGVQIRQVDFVGFDDNPKSEHQNVTFYYLSFIKDHTLINNIFDNRGGEENEVSDVKWIPVDELDNYQWAFGHKSIIKKIAYEYGEKNYISRY